MRYGYIRPIVQDQQCTKQLLNIDVTHVVKEKHGLANKRVELEHLFMTFNKATNYLFKTSKYWLIRSINC